MTEIWIDVPKYEGHYKVSNTGKIKSLKNKKPRILKGFVDKQGKLKVALRRYDKSKYLFVHRIVYYSFNNKNVTSDTCIIHLDNDLDNNTLDNLKEMSLSEASHYYRQNNELT